MGKLDDVKLTIDANIRENGNEDITGGVLNLVLTDVVEAAEVELVQLGNRVSVLEQNGGGSGGGGGSIDPALLVGYVVVSNEETEGAIERNKAAYKKIRYATSPLYVSLDHSFRSRVDYVNGFYSEMVDGEYEDFVYLTGLYTYPVETGDYDRYRAIYIRKFKLYESGKLRGGNYYYEDSDLNEESGRAVQNMVVTAKFKEVEEGISSVAASIMQEIVDNECVTAAALNDLNDRIKKLEEQLKNAES